MKRDKSSRKPKRGITRRGFIELCAIAGSGIPARGSPVAAIDGVQMVPEKLLGNLKEDGSDTPIEGATWYRSIAEGDGLLYRIAPGALTGAGFLTADMLLDGSYQTVFQLVLQEGESGPAFKLGFALLNQCSARVRMPLSAVDQNRWMLQREGAWLKPLAGGDRVDLKRVDRMILKVLRSGGRPSRWCLTRFTACPGEAPRITAPILPKGPLLDELGQSRLHQWPGKSITPEEAATRLKKQLESAPDYRLPDSFSRYGGWKEKQFQATGYFRTHNDGKRWWLVDPEGYAFWSAGMDCVRVDTEANYGGLQAALSWRPEQNGTYERIFGESEGRGSKSINYLAANFIRAFGEKWYGAWKEIALAELRRLGFNTVGNWSDSQIAREKSVPYVVPLSPHFAKTTAVYRDFPDVFSPAFRQDAARYAGQLREFADDPALLGYFLMNEPTWGFSTELPAAGMLYTTPTCASREELARFLRKRYPDEASLSAAWQVSTTFDEVARGPWKKPLRAKAMEDLEAFSEIMTVTFFRTLNEFCKQVDPKHLNLGIRYHTVPPRWVIAGMSTFDVFSMNCYREKVPLEATRKISEALKMPVLVGEWHFGALDAGLPASGIGHVRNQQARGQAYRVYLEDAAANPDCVGVHWFTLYDQSALGRFDGENYNIGFLDVCNRPYEALGLAARASHERLYKVASGAEQPYADAPEYLPKLFM